MPKFALLPQPSNTDFIGVPVFAVMHHFLRAVHTLFEPCLKREIPLFFFFFFFERLLGFHGQLYILSSHAVENIMERTG